MEESVNPDTLDSLFVPAQSNGSQGGYVEFTYCDHHVTVPLDGDRTITVAETPSTAPQGTGRSAP